MSDGPEDSTEDFSNRPAKLVLAGSRARSADRQGTARASDDVERVTDAIERLSDRIESAESRQALAIAGVERSVREVIGRIDAAERDQMQTTARVDGDLAKARGETSRLTERLRRIEDEAAGPRSAEALRALEGVIGNVAGQLNKGERRTRDAVSEIRERVNRLDAAENATLAAMRELQASCSALDERLSLVDRIGSQGVEKVAETLSARVASVREELGRQIAEAADARFDRVDLALAKMSEHVRSAEHRSAVAIERMGREVLEVAQNLNRRMQTVEHRSADVAGRMSADMSRIAGAVEARLIRTDSIQAQALEKLGGEIARITERLADRIANSERRSAQAIDDLGAQVAEVSEKLGERHEQSASELSERIRQSEERTAKLLGDARLKLDGRPGGLLQRASEFRVLPARAPSADDTLYLDAPIPAFEPLRAKPIVPMDQPPALAQPRVFGVAAYGAGDAKAATDDETLELELAPQTLGSPAPEPLAPDAFLVGAAGEEPRQPLLPESIAPEAAPPELPAGEGSAEASTSEAPYFSAYAAATLETLDDEELFAEAGSAPASSDASPDIEAGAQAIAPEPPAEVDVDLETVALEPNVGFDMDPAPIAATAGRAAEDDFDDFAGPAPALTTRDIIERARAAARERDRSRRPLSPANESVLEGVTFGRSRQRNGSGALMVASLLAAVGLAGGGYLLIEGEPSGKLPKPVSDVLALAGGGAPVPSTPLAAVALAPKPIAVAPGQDLTGAYSAAAAEIGAGQAAGLADLRKLVDAGYAPAQFYLAELYQDGKAGLKQDPAAARHWLQRAAEGGDRTAMHNLALDEHEGVGGARDVSAAAEWFRRAAELGLLDSQFNLAALYEHGDGVAQNPAEAYKWYLVAARAGDQEARAGAFRVRAGLSADARAVAERAAADFQPTTPQAQTPILVAAPPAVPATPAAASPDLVTAQKALTQLGYYQGPTDGAASPAIHLALAAYQRNQGLPITGAPDPTTLGKLAARAQ